MSGEPLAHAPAARDPERDVVDRRILALIAEYVRLTGAHVDHPAPDLLRLRLPSTEAAAFGGRTQHLLALDLVALDRNQAAELPVIGGAFWAGLVAAIRRHGSRCVAGTLPLTVTSVADAPDVPPLDARVEPTGRQRELRRIVRVTAKVTMAAGTAIRDEVIQSEAIDLTTGSEVPASVAALLEVEAPRIPVEDIPAATATAADRLVAALIYGLEQRVAAQVALLHGQAERELRAELQRIDRYYEALKDEVRGESGPGTAALRAIEHEHEKRRTEETRRHGVRVDVQPLQVLERGVVVERVAWRLTTPAGRTAELHGHRYLSGDGAWGIHCPRCRQPPTQLSVCRAGHAVGSECTHGCSVCAERFCLEHGHAACAIDGAPVCSEHAAECWSCERVYCAAHESTCADGGHAACVDCIDACAICGRGVCRKHVTVTHESSPRGARSVCSNCIVFCEGGTSEPVGRDEAEACGTCGRHICERHQVRCVIDERPHCSRHLRRTDRSRRFICPAHSAACDHESAEVLYAADEVHACIECGRTSCNEHGQACHGDGRWHCHDHLVKLNDIAGAAACRQHHSTCHVDGQAFSLTGTAACDVCARAACRAHAAQCGWCGARACTDDMRGDRCVTCRELKLAVDLPDDVIGAVARVSGEVRPKQRLVARDGTRFVVQLDLGWTRKLVITVPHGGASATRVVRHSIFGTSGLQP